MGGENKSQSKDVLFTRSRVRLFRTNWCEILCNLNSWRPFTHYPSFSLSPPQSITSCLPLILRSATRSRANGDTRHLDVDYKGGEDFSVRDAAPPNLFPINYCYLLLCRRGGGKCPFSEDIFPKISDSNNSEVVLSQSPTMHRDLRSSYLPQLFQYMKM